MPCGTALMIINSLLKIAEPFQRGDGVQIAYKKGEKLIYKSIIYGNLCSICRDVWVYIHT